MSKNRQIWDTKENAEAYDKYASNFTMYKDTSRDLVEISGIKAGMRICDLAAGTGMTTEAILEKTGENVHIFVIDQAEAMLNIAKQKITSNNVHFIVSPAENIDKVIKEPVDEVICNSAFWQMNAEQVLKSVSNILKHNGVFAFNLPDSLFSYTDFEKQPVSPLPYNLDDLISWAKEAGLILESHVIKTYSKTLAEILAFNEIHVMKRNFNKETEKREFLARSKPQATDGSGKRQWVYLVFRKS